MCIVYGIHFVIIHSLNYSDFVSTFSILMIKKIKLLVNVPEIRNFKISGNLYFLWYYDPELIF